MEITEDLILEKVSNLIDFEEVVSILELDLNTIAQQIITNPQDQIEFKVFFDAGDFDALVNSQAPGEGMGFNVTPVLLSFVNGTFQTETGPQLLQSQFRIESFGFKKDMENTRKVFATYSSLNRGTIVTEFTTVAKATSLMDFPVFSEVMQYKGFERVSCYMSWLLTFFYNGQLANEVSYKINGMDINLMDFNIKRLKTGSSIHRNNDTETRTLNTSQILGFTGFTLYDGSSGTKELLNAIKTETLNYPITLEVTYPMLGDISYDDLNWTEVSLTTLDPYLTHTFYVDDYDDYPEPLYENSTLIVEPYSASLEKGEILENTIDLDMSTLSTEPTNEEVYQALHEQQTSWWNAPTFPQNVKATTGSGNYYYVMIDQKTERKFYQVVDPEPTYNSLVETYETVLQEGDIQIKQGNYLNLTFALALK